MHFLDITAMIKKGLHERLVYKPVIEEAAAESGILSTVYNWFMPQDREVQDKHITTEGDDCVLADKKFLKALKHKIKMFEVCVRIYEQECIAAIIATQREV